MRYILDSAKLIITARIIPSLPEHCGAALGHLEIQVKPVVDVFRWMDVGDRTLSGIRFYCDLNPITATPVDALSTFCYVQPYRKVFASCLP